MHNSSTVTGLPPQLPMKQIAVAAQALIDLLDALGGDAEMELDDPPEANGDELDRAWIEWDGMRGSQKGGPNIIGDHEDDEDSDPAEDDNEDCEGRSEGEPMFGRADCGALNAIYGDGPGGGSLLDSDLGGDGS